MMPSNTPVPKWKEMLATDGAPFSRSLICPLHHEYVLTCVMLGPVSSACTGKSLPRIPSGVGPVFRQGHAPLNKTEHAPASVGTKHGLMHRFGASGHRIALRRLRGLVL